MTAELMRLDELRTELREKITTLTHEQPDALFVVIPLRELSYVSRHAEHRAPAMQYIDGRRGVLPSDHPEDPPKYQIHVYAYTIEVDLAPDVHPKPVDRLVDEALRIAWGESASVGSGGTFTIALPKLLREELTAMAESDQKRFRLLFSEGLSLRGLRKEAGRLSDQLLIRKKG